MRSLSEAQQLEDLPHTIALFQEDRCAPIARWIEVLMDAAARCSASRDAMRTFSMSTWTLQAASATHRLQRPKELCFEMLRSSGILLWAKSMSGEGCRDQLAQSPRQRSERPVGRRRRVTAERPEQAAMEFMEELRRITPSKVNA